MFSPAQLVQEEIQQAPPDLAIVRNLYDDERLPEGLNTGFEHCAVTPDWCWVLERDCGVVAALLAAPFHGIVFLGRLSTMERRCRSADVLVLLRRAVRDMQDRGFNAYIVFLEEGHRHCGKLARILKRSGAILFEPKHICAGGALAKLGRW
jgi:hypothetical protein